jgi:hypothetical protein
MIVSTTTTDRNPGIVPPWLTEPASVHDADRNPGIVPPWLTEAPSVRDTDRNPGIVPPWLIGDETPRILPVDSPNATVQTTFDREPADASPPRALADALRARMGAK